MTYVSKGVYPVDMYVSKEFNSNREILVCLFDKNETKDLYAEWLANRPTKEETDDE